MTRDDVVLQRPEDLVFSVPVFHTVNACCGAATAYLLRRIAYRAGAYAPGIQEHIFHELNTSREGGTIEKVQRWFNVRTRTLAELGYRLQCRRVAVPTQPLLEWVRQGKGYRGAMLPTSFKRLHPGDNAAGKDAPDDAVGYHAIGVTMEQFDPKVRAPEELVMVDPWPGVDGVAEDRAKVTPLVDLAHKDRGLHALMFFWTGWS
ncbi:MAG TPA: hypothetical protein VIV58_29375 [Kofleriaceae bacterium]